MNKYLISCFDTSLVDSELTYLYIYEHLHLRKWNTSKCQGVYHDLEETRSYAKPSSKYATYLASARETRKKRDLACALYISRHYGVDVGWRYAEQQ